MIGLVVIVVLVVLIVAALKRYESSPPPLDEIDYRVAADLYAIRRRLDVEQFKQEVRRDGRRLKQELDRELGE